MKKTFNKALCLFIVLMIVFSIIPTSTFALFEKYNYVSLGDSMSNGYALEGFEAPGYKVVVKQSYPYLFAKEIDANLTPMAYNGLRVEDIYFLFNEDYEGDDYLRRRFIDNGSFQNAGGGVDKMRADIKKAVSEADYVSITMGGNNFTSYFGAQFEAWQSDTGAYKFDRPGYSSKSKILASEEYKEIEQSVRDIFTALGKGKQVVELAINSLRYTYTGFMEYFDDVIDEIYKLNPDVTLMVNGLNNPMEGVHLINGFINAGTVVHLLAEHINDFMKNKTAFADRENYLFVDIMGAEVNGTPKNVFDEEFFALCEGNKFAEATHPNAAGHEFIKDRMIDRINVPYYDVSRDNECFDAVAFVCENGLMDAKEAHKFAPDSLATRGMVATALYRAALTPEIESEFDFMDVRDGMYYTEAAKWAAENDIISPITTKIFLPYGGMTRQNLAVALWNAGGQPQSEKEYKFTDSLLISKSAKTAMNWAVENGIITALCGNFIAPRIMVTRADLAQALFALYGE
ncbi:MAG: hypothetical protein IJO48_05560 [Clostridia bacterium]|nr:hypothetical protein [Clostridia bacterium]